MTFPGWVDVIDGVRVERQEGRRPGGQAYLRLVDSTRRVIWHTTEGSSVDGAVSTLRSNFSCPHFVVGPDRIVQMRPLWAEAATVRGDNSRAWQVEVVGFSKQGPWQHDAGTRRAVVALLRYFRDRLNVPLARPDGWRDDCSDIDGVWATEGNSRRRSNRAPGFAGHVMHLEWPENTHWDQGAVTWSPLLTEAGEDEMTNEERAKLNKLWNYLQGVDDVLDPADESIDALGTGRRIGRAVKTVEAADGAAQVHCSADCSCRTELAQLRGEYDAHRHGEGRTSAPVAPTGA